MPARMFKQTNTQGLRECAVFAPGRLQMVRKNNGYLLCVGFLDKSKKNRGPVIIHHQIFILGLMEGLQWGQACSARLP